MSATVSTLISNIRQQTRDLDEGNYVCDSDRMLYKVATAVMDVAGRLDVSMAWVTGLVTLADGDYDYALDDTSEYNTILAVRRSDDRYILHFEPPEVLEYRRQTDVVGVGAPTSYALLNASPAAAGVEAVTMLVYPTPTSTDAGVTLDALVTYEPSVTATSSVIPFTERAIRAIEYSVGASVLAEATDEQLAQLALTRDVASMWDNLANKFLQQEETRIYKMRRPSGIAGTQVY
jgi:hypothetical protein